MKTDRTQPLSRRDFLTRSVATGGALGLLPATSSSLAGDTDTRERLTAAVIGCGGIATHHANVNFAPWFRIAAICDVDQARVEAYRPLAPEAEIVAADYREILEHPDVDVIFVCTPDHWHTKITVDALRSGKDVYCEKPLTFSVEEGTLIERVLEQTGRVLQVGTQQRSDPNFQTAVALARSGRLGALQRVTVAIGGGPVGGPFSATAPPESLDWDRWLGQAPAVPYIPERCHGNFRWWYEYSGGKLTDWGAHHVDIALWALGDDGDGIVALEVLDSKHPLPMIDGWPNADDSYNTASSFRVRCRFDHGAELIIRDNAADLGFDNGILFECEGGRFFVNRGKLTGKPIEQLQQQPLPEDALRDLRRGANVMPHMENFFVSCRQRTTPLSDATSHIRHLNVCHVANIALRSGRDLRWDPSRGRITNDEDADRMLRRQQRAGFEVV